MPNLHTLRSRNIGYDKIFPAFVSKRQQAVQSIAVEKDFIIHFRIEVQGDSCLQRLQSVIPAYGTFEKMRFMSLFSTVFLIFFTDFLLDFLGFFQEL